MLNKNGFWLAEGGGKAGSSASCEGPSTFKHPSEILNLC